jgi:hypothetical protein
LAGAAVALDVTAFDVALGVGVGAEVVAGAATPTDGLAATTADAGTAPSSESGRADPMMLRATNPAGIT